MLVIDPEFEALIRPLPADQYKILEENILADGCIDALRTWDGILIDGHHRFKICTGHGLPYKTVSIDLRDRRSVRLWMIKNQLGRRDLTDLERVELVRMYRVEKEAEAAERHREGSSKGGKAVESFPQPSESIKTRDELGEMAGMSGRTFEKYEKVLDYGTPELIEMTRRGEVSASTASVVAEMSEEIQKDLVQKGKKELVAAAKTEVESRHREYFTEKAKAHVLHNTGQIEWYTPAQYIEAAREVMGSIDTDPASCEAANQTVKATTFYTKETNGLIHPWAGNVWMNPPFAHPLIVQFCEALIEKFQNGDVTQACVLVNNGTDTGWGQLLIQNAGAVCFSKGRVRCVDKDLNLIDSGPLQGQMFCYFGPRVAEFAAAFSSFGTVLYGSNTK